MESREPSIPDDDVGFPPPDEPIEVFCLHCGQRYQSDTMIYGPLRPGEPEPLEMWHCPTPGCGAGGFGLDIFPTDPNWKDPKGLLHIVTDDEDADADLDDELAGGPRPSPGTFMGFFHDDGTPMSPEEFFRAE